MRSPWFIKFTVLSNEMGGAIFNTPHDQNFFFRTYTLRSPNPLKKGALEVPSN